MELFQAEKSYLITGCAGFIGSHLALELLKAGACVTGIDNLNDYYSVDLKEERLGKLQAFGGFTFEKIDISDGASVMEIFERVRPEIVIHLAAQAGVRYSIECPESYISSNIVGFFHMLEAVRRYPAKHVIYASSSSVYGGNKKVPFSEEDQVDKPVSLYAATKKSNELMAYSYSKLYDIPLTGLRFFTVYGPFGRPDMAYFKFAEKIMRGETIEVYNQGDMYRDFTYVDDVVKGIMSMLNHPPVKDGDGVRYKIYNIGNNSPERLMDFITCLEKALGKSADKVFLPMQQGDVYQTYADMTKLMEDFDYRPDTPLEEGIPRFTQWFLDYYHKKGK